MFRPVQLVLRPIAIILATSGLCPFAAAETQWHAVQTRETAFVHFYVDGATLTPGKTVSRVRLMYDFAEPQFNEEFGTYSKSYVVDSQIDCKRSQIAATRMSLFAGSGASGKLLGRTTEEKTPKWASAPPGSINRAIVDAACSLLQAKR
jgi:hypothetical protein